MPSTVIASIEYNAEAQVLKIQFVSGLVYAYKNVPETIYLELRASKLKGIYFNRYIKNKFSFEKIN